MQRVTALWQASPNKIVGALFALALAAMMAVASGASFTSTSANVGNIVTAGNLSHENSKPNDGMILSVDKLIPGGPAGTGTVTITNDGDVKGLFTLSKDGIDDSDDDNPLSEKLIVTIEDISDAPVEIYEGTIADMLEQDMGDIDSGQSREYRFSVRFPEGGPPPSATTGDNAYKGDSVEVDYQWESVTE